MRDLAGRTALVTGAASGIGRGLALALGAEGMTLAIADIAADPLAETEALLRGRGVEVLAAPLDTRDRAGWHALVGRIEQTLGPVQLLCNNAGVTVAPTPAADLSGEQWDWVMGINLTGTFNGASAVIARLRALGLPGHIVNTASIQGLYGTPGFAAYNASKFGIVGFSETLRMELAADGIGVSVLCPGPTRTNMMASSAAIAPDIVKGAPGRARPGFTHYQTGDEVAAKVVAAIREDLFYIVSHPEYRPLLEARWQALDASIAADPDPDATANILGIETLPMATFQAMTRVG